MILTAKDFIPDIQAGLTKAPADIRAFAKWQFIHNIEQANLPSLIAEVLTLGGGNTPIYCLNMLALAPSTKGHTGQGTTLVFDPVTHKFQLLWGNGIMPKDEPVPLSKDGWDGWMRERIKKLDIIGTRASYNIDYTVADFSIAQADSHVRGMSARYARDILKAFEKQAQEHGIRQLGHEKHDDWKDAIKKLITTTAYMVMRSAFNELMEYPDQELLQHLQEKPTAPLQYYNIAAQDGSPGFENAQRLAFLISPYVRFTNPNNRDGITENILDAAANGLHPAAAVAKVLGVEANTVHNFINANPPRTIRSQLVNAAVPTERASRDLVASLDSIPLGLWPRGDLEWAAFFRMQEFAWVHHDRDNLPDLISVPELLAALAEKPFLKGYNRWHGAEAFMLSPLARRLQQKERYYPERINGKRVGTIIEGPYWTTNIDNEGNIVEHDIHIARMQRIINPAYETLWNLPDDKAYNHFQKLLDAKKPFRPAPKRKQRTLDHD